MQKMTIKQLREDPIQVRRMRIALARKSFRDYCWLLYGDHYTKDRQFLIDICDKLQAFIEQDRRRFLVINLPPRHYKSFTASSLVEWLFGRNIGLKVMTGSYNEILSTSFARKVRDAISEKAVAGGKIVYGDVFPKTKIKYGQASASLWALDGSSQDNYLATSPTGTATGFGANVLLIDDLIKNAEEAYNELTLDKHWQWFANTMIQRLEGKNWKVIVIMTRWAMGDLAGRIIEAFGDDVEVITKKAIQEDGNMLCPDILSREDYVVKTKEMSIDIVEANYNQKPIDISGRLYGVFKEWEKLPPAESGVVSFCDTADTGTDFLCAICGVVYDKEFYVTDVVFSDEPMEITERKVAEMLNRGGVMDAQIESNNGGRGFARNVERLLYDMGNRRCQIRAVPQHKNKESRILASSAWVANHVYMPLGWRQRYPDFYKQIMSYQRKGKNAHDDAVDVLASIYEAVSEDREVELIDKSAVGLSARRRAYHRANHTR